LTKPLILDSAQAKASAKDVTIAIIGDAVVANAVVNRNGATVVNRDGHTIVADPAERTS